LGFVLYFWVKDCRLDLVKSNSKNGRTQKGLGRSTGGWNVFGCQVSLFRLSKDELAWWGYQENEMTSQEGPLQGL
jgi:hypothetical protein